MLVRNSPCIIALYNGGSKAPIRVSRRGRSSLVIHFARPGMFRLFSFLVRRNNLPIQPSCQQTLDLYLETWLWSPLICAEKAPTIGRGG